MIRMLSAADKHAEIKRLYYQTSRTTIAEDFAKAIDLLKSMVNEEERERVAVYMDGLAQMRSDWARERGGPPGGSRQSKVNSRKSTVGSRQSKVGSSKSEVRSPKPEVGSARSKGQSPQTNLGHRKRT